jgi:hypothetical protein
VQNQKFYLDPPNPNTLTWHWIEDDAALLPRIPAELCAFLRRTKEMGFAFSFLENSQTNSSYSTVTKSLPPPPPAHNTPPSNTTHKKLPHCRILSLSLSLSLCDYCCDYHRTGSDCCWVPNADWVLLGCKRQGHKFDVHVVVVAAAAAVAANYYYLQKLGYLFLSPATLISEGARLPHFFVCYWLLQATRQSWSLSLLLLSSPLVHTMQSPMAPPGHCPPAPHKLPLLTASSTCLCTTLLLLHLSYLPGVPTYLQKIFSPLLLVFLLQIFFFSTLIFFFFGIFFKFLVSILVQKCFSSPFFFGFRFFFSPQIFGFFFFCFKIRPAPKGGLNYF